jgi:hypothetical protein
MKISKIHLRDQTFLKFESYTQLLNHLVFIPKTTSLSSNSDRVSRLMKSVMEHHCEMLTKPATVFRFPLCVLLQWSELYIGHCQMLSLACDLLHRQYYFVTVCVNYEILPS